MKLGNSSESDSDWGTLDKPGEFATDGPIRIQSKSNGTLDSGVITSNKTLVSRQNGSQSQTINGGRADLEYLLKGESQKLLDKNQASHQKLANGTNEKSKKKTKSVSVGPSVQSDSVREEGEDDDRKVMNEDGKADEQIGFLPSKAFKGTKTGYVFTSGTQGTGYYQEKVSKTTEKKVSSKKSGKKLADLSNTVEDSIAEVAVEEFCENIFWWRGGTTRCMLHLCKVKIRSCNHEDKAFWLRKQDNSRMKSLEHDRCQCEKTVHTVEKCFTWITPLWYNIVLGNVLPHFKKCNFSLDRQTHCSSVWVNLMCETFAKVMWICDDVQCLYDTSWITRMTSYMLWISWSTAIRFLLLHQNCRLL